MELHVSGSGGSLSVSVQSTELGRGSVGEPSEIRFLVVLIDGKGDGSDSE